MVEHLHSMRELQKDKISAAERQNPKIRDSMFDISLHTLFDFSVVLDSGKELQPQNQCY